MRETDSLEPMWEAEETPSLRARLLVGGATVAKTALQWMVPQVFHFASGQQPALHFSWGPKEYRIGPEGLQSRRRSERGWEDNPRSNYNDAVEKKQKRANKPPNQDAD